MGKLILLFCFITIGYIGYSDGIHYKTGGYGHHWTYFKNYGGPSEWPRLQGIEHNECGGQSQSPISIDARTAIVTNGRLNFVDHDHYYPNSLLYNNGHNVNLTLGQYEPQPRLQVSLGDGRVQTYNFDQSHFHFGQQSDHGSEHVVNGVRYPMEMHAVYYDARYRTFTEAAEARAALAIVSVLYQVDYADNMRLSAVTSNVRCVTEPGSTARIGFTLSDLFPVDKEAFYNYQGSLTTPPCTQTPTWFVLHHPCPVSENQLKEFRKLKKSLGKYEPHDWAHEHVADNIRPTQSLNGRTVYSHPNTHTDGPVLSNYPVWSKYVCYPISALGPFSVLPAYTPYKN